MTEKREWAKNFLEKNPADFAGYKIITGHFSKDQRNKKTIEII